MSKRKINTLFYKESDGEVTALEGPHILKALKRDTGLKPAEAEEMWSLILKGAEEPGGLEDLSAAEAKPYKTAFSTMKKVLAFHDKEVERQKTAVEKEEVKLQELGEKMVVAGMRGFAKAGAFEEDMVVSGLQAVVGKKILISSVGATFKEDTQMSELEFTEAIAAVSNITSRFDSGKQSAVFVLGDICNEAMKYQNGEMVLAQAVRLTGKDKHTIKQAMNMCAWIPQNKRVPGLTGTHYIEAMAFRDGSKSDYPLTDAKLFKLLEKAAVGGEKIIDIETPDGEKKLQTASVSTLRFREMLNEAAGKPNKEPKEKSPEPPLTEREQEQVETAISNVRSRGYLYLMGSEQLQHEELSTSALKEFCVIDLDTMIRLNQDGSEGPSIERLPDGWFPQAEAPASKPKKKKAKKESEVPAEELAGLPE